MICAAVLDFLGTRRSERITVPATQDSKPAVVADRPAGVPFDVKIVRARRDDKAVVHVMRFMPEELESARATRIATALQRKNPKLAAAKREHGATSILVLESDDIALANRHVIAVAVRSGLAQRSDIPDTVYLVETDRGHAWQLWIIREDGRDITDSDDHAGPHQLPDLAGPPDAE